jgi:hypothetical protein
LLIFIPLCFLSPQNFEIKTLRVYPSGDETSLPVITSEESITIEFDLQADFIPDMNIVFRFCDKSWNPYNNLFLANPGQNIEYNIDFDLLPFTVEGARYHFRSRFPNDNNYVSFPFSGKWRFYITDSQDTSRVYASGKFYVITPEVSIDAALKKELLEEKIYNPLELGRIFNITTEINLPPELFPNFVDQLEIVENKKIYSPVIIDRTFNTNIRQFYWNGDRKFSFIARDIYPGNEYRQVDTRNFNVYNSRDVKAQFDGIEYSRFYKDMTRRDLNGGSLLVPYKNEFAEYLNVTFSFRPPEEIYSSIFLVGTFNDWQLLPEYELQNKSGLYTITIPLKRGIFDYQYVTADLMNNSITNENWIYLEGNYWETTNVYHIFLFYTDPNYGGYDKIIGYQKLISR